jgi:hypothetical protein
LVYDGYPFRDHAEPEVWMATLVSYIVLAIPPVGCVACGLFGGILNRILVTRNLGLTSNNEPQKSWEYGPIGDVLIGAGAGLATYFYGMYDLPLGRILLLALFGGVSGGNFFSNALQLKEFKKEKTRTRIYKGLAEGDLKPRTRRRQKDVE